jgi:signal transduction histidine kinase/ligand-binding sensor domain-containing protein
MFDSSEFFEAMSSIIISNREKNRCHRLATGDFSDCLIGPPLLAWYPRRAYYQFLMMQKRMRVWPVLLIGIFALTVTALVAADDSEWLSRAWQLDDGLPGNSVTGVLQTPDGYLWLATEGGLARFDGVHFQNIPVSIPSGRTRPIIRAMSLGQENKIWLALEGGLVFSLSAQSTNLFTTANGLSRVRPDSIVQDKKSDVWISYSDGSVCRIANGQVTRFAESNAPAGRGSVFLASDIKGQVWFSRGENVGIVRDGTFQSILKPSERVIHLGQAHAGGMWVCAGLQLMHCDESGATVNCGTLPVDHSGVEPTVVFEDRNGAVWVGTSVNGLFRYDGTNFTRVETSYELIMSLGEDNEGNIWAGTGGGGLDRLRQRVVELQTGASGLPSTTVRSICEDATGVMWAVTQNGGLARRTVGNWKTMTSEDGWSGASATCVVSDGKGGLWIGTSEGSLQRWANGRFSALGRTNGLGGETVRALLMDHAGDLWIALESPNCLQRLHQDKFQTFKQTTSGAIRALAEDDAGTILCGTSDGFLLGAEDDKLKNETTHTLSKPSPIRCMNEMPDGSVWIGYAGSGIGIWRKGKFSQITEQQGLYDPYICSMALDEDGGFWCATDHGVFQIPLREIEAVAEGRDEQVHSIRFGRDEGLPNLQGSFGYAPGEARSRDGRIWFPTRSGLAVVNPLHAPANRVAPPVFVELVTVDGHPTSADAAGRFILPAGYRRLNLDFTAPTFISPEDVQFRYRLEGWDSTWIDGGKHRSTIYSRLPAGDYTFCVTACNKAGIWNPKATTVALTVSPLLWERWPVRIAGLLVFTLAVIAAVRYISFRRLTRKLSRLEQETSLQRERSRIAQDLHDDIGASLNHIALLSELAQKDFEKPLQAREHIDHIFRNARKVVRSLDEIVWTVNPKNYTLDVFIAYLCTYAPEYLHSAGIRCRLDVPVEVPAVPLPSEVGHHLYLAVKETLHNIVKHAGATEVWLRLRLEAGTITLTVEDNGCGFKSDCLRAPDADGLGNLTRRLAEIGGCYEQRSGVGKGTTNIFTVPLKKPIA